MTQEEANKILNDFDSSLESLVCEKLAETDITPEQVNEYYGFYNHSEIADRLIEQRKFLESLK